MEGPRYTVPLLASCPQRTILSLMTATSSAVMKFSEITGASTQLVPLYSQILVTAPAVVQLPTAEAVTRTRVPCLVTAQKPEFRKTAVQDGGVVLFTGLDQADPGIPKTKRNKLERRSSCFIRDSLDEPKEDNGAGSGKEVWVGEISTVRI